MATAEKTIITTVTMTDGRVVDFAGKRKMLKTSFEDADGELAVRLDFVNGETRTVTLHPALLSKFATHGAEQKLGDEIAGIPEVDDCVLAIDELVERLDAGEWGQPREAGGMAGTSMLAKALMEFKGVSAETAKTFLKARTSKEKTALRNKEPIRNIILRLEAEKAAKSGGDVVDTEALLDTIA